MKKAPTTFQEDGASGEQLSFLPPLELCPKWPRSGTHPYIVLSRMLTGERLTQPSYGFHGWRLAAYIKELKYLGWLIESADIPPPPTHEGTRPIRQYWLNRTALAQALAMLRGSNG